ncbi:hypothetical protein FRC08_000091 [Ceratobasidium sp. 394]|nr:hypothetical protein FRC08_000091 [Ceratobasidium sp. 394]
MADSREINASPTNAATLAEYDQHYRPYNVPPERDVDTMLKRVEEVLQHVDRVLEHNSALFSPTDYAALTSKHRSYLAELAEEKQLRQTSIDDVVARSPILSVLYAIKERGLDRAVALLRNVELFQTEILAAIQPSPCRTTCAVMDQPASLPEPSDYLNLQPNEIVGLQPLGDQKFLAATHSQQLTPAAGSESSTTGPSTATPSGYRRKIIYENAGRRVEVVDAAFRPTLLDPDGQNQEMDIC